MYCGIKKVTIFEYNLKLKQMEKEFIPYEQALDLKELWFDEPCFARYYYEVKDNKLMFFQPNYARDFNSLTINLTGQKNNDKPLFVSVPTFSQAFRWFREKYDFDVSIAKDSHNIYHFQIDTNHYGNWILPIFNRNYEEAEIECLKKLIEIAKTK